MTGLCLFRKPDPGYFDGADAWRREPGGGVILINLIHVVDDLRNLCGEITRCRPGVPRRPRLPRRGYGRDPAALSPAARSARCHFRRRRTLELGADLGRGQGLPEDRRVLLPDRRHAGLLERAAPGFMEHEGDGWWTPIGRDRSTRSRIR